MPSPIVSGWSTLRPAILSILQGIDQFAFVDDKYTLSVTGFPAAMFEPSADPADFSTNQSDLHEYTYTIYLVQEMEKGGRNEAIRILSNSVDAVTYAFLNDDSLGGACLYSRPLPSEWGETTMGEGMVKYAKLTLKCYILHQKT